MSTYQGIRGLKVRDYTTNPDDPLEGQLWYNKTDQVGKYQIPNVTASWRTINSLNTGRYHAMGTGIYTATICYGGYNSPDYKANTENWNGSAWSEINDMNTARGSFSSIGTTSTAALAAGGYPTTAKNEDWNGASWVEVADLSAIRGNSEGAGTSTAGFAFGGDTPPGSTVTTATEEWSGSSVTIKVLTD